MDELVTRSLEVKVAKESRELSSGWSSPRCDEKLKRIRQDGIPRQMHKQTEWAVSVWVQWASYRGENIIEQSETVHPSLTNFIDVSEDVLKFWLVKFVTEARHTGGKPYPPNSLSDVLWTWACSVCSAD